MRLNKYLAKYAGVSRRDADRLIGAGEVRINDETARIGMDVDEGGDEVYLSGRRIEAIPDRHYYAVNKPVGYISSTVRQDESDRLVTELLKNVTDLRLFPMGRLDKDSEGLIILTDDGELMDKVLRSRYGHEKEYEVRLKKSVPDDVLKSIAKGGVDIGEKRRTKPCTINRTANNRVEMTITEGMNRQIRRVFERHGYGVTGLKRIRFMNVELGGLRPGECRELTADEIDEMRRMAEA